MVEIVIFNFVEQHLRGSAPDLKTRGNYAGETRYHLPAHLQTVEAGDGDLLRYGQLTLAAPQ